MRKGFTLIETLVYLGLFSIIIGSTLMGAYQIIEGSERLNTKTVLIEEANFLLGKINWALGSTSEIIIPISNTTSTELYIKEADTSGTLLGFDIVEGNLLYITPISEMPIPLNSSSVIVSDPLFEHISNASGETIKIHLLLNNEPFDSITFLRK